MTLEGQHHFAVRLTDQAIVDEISGHDNVMFPVTGGSVAFELYGEDAKTAALELDLTLTLRNIPEYGRLPMCGFPAHALEDNAARLTAQGYDVTVAALEETQPMS
mgnify:CR=1 FL=1